MNQKKLIILTGPTSVGKSALSILLAKEIGGEIISADSMQVYRNMDIGSAKITEKEMDGVTHHLIDILEPTEDFDVTKFKQYAKKAMEGIYERGHIPILVGGTGFYIQALLYDIDFNSNATDLSLRKKLEAMSVEKGPEYMHEWLKRIDPDSAKKIHANNVKRVIRAIEFYEQTGTQISKHNEMEHAKKSPYDFRYFVLTMEREKLYNRIEKRVDLMLEAGLVNEVQKLKDFGCKKGMTSMQGLGYKEILSYLDEEITLDEAIYLIKRDTRRFAKRQLTWFRREPDVIMIHKDEFFSEKEILTYMVNQINTP